MGQGKKESKEKGIRSNRESIKEELGEWGAREEGIMGTGYQEKKG